MNMLHEHVHVIVPKEIMSILTGLRCPWYSVIYYTKTNFYDVSLPFLCSVTTSVHSHGVAVDSHVRHKYGDDWYVVQSLRSC
jgi:hypothetical protein